jgi:hypothetical protein
LLAEPPFQLVRLRLGEQHPSLFLLPAAATPKLGRRRIVGHVYVDSLLVIIFNIVVILVFVFVFTDVVIVTAAVVVRWQRQGEQVWQVGMMAV